MQSIVHINGYVLLLKLGSCGGKFGTALACEVQSNIKSLLRVIAGGGAFNIGGALENYVSVCVLLTLTEGDKRGLAEVLDLVLGL